MDWDNFIWSLSIVTTICTIAICITVYNYHDDTMLEQACVLSHFTTDNPFCNNHILMRGSSLNETIKAGRQ
jgi:hypothetical protein